MCHDSLAIIEGILAEGDEGQVTSRVGEWCTWPRQAQHVLRGENISRRFEGKLCGHCCQ